MTRKRFIKLLMARGYSRNGANEIARRGYKGQPYTELYFAACLPDVLPGALDAVFEAARCAALAAAEVVKHWLDEDIPRVVQAVAYAAQQITENMNRLREAHEGKPSE